MDAVLGTLRAEDRHEVRRQCSGRILLYGFGELTQLIDQIEQFRHLVRKYDKQSGEFVTDNVRQAAFQAGIKDASIRDHLALHAGRLNSFDKMATEVSTFARTSNESDIVPMNTSKLKDGKSKDGKGKDGEEKTKGKDGKDKVESKSSSQTKDKKCFHCGQDRPRESRLSEEEER